MDNQIVAILREDGRIPTMEIARRLSVSEGTIRKRLGRLAREHVVQVIATSNIRLLGYRQEMTILLKTAPPKIRSVIDALKAIDRVRYVALVGGAYNVIMTVAFESDRAAARFLVDELANIDGVLEFNAMPMLRVVKRSYDWLASDDLMMADNVVQDGQNE